MTPTISSITPVSYTHLDVYKRQAEITAQSGPIADGAIADVLSAKGRWLGSAFYNSHSKIRGRLISRNANDTFNEAFWRRRLQYAWDYRKSVLSPEDLSCCRVIFGEADAFPGLTVDRFNDILVVQILSLSLIHISGQS